MKISIKEFLCFHDVVERLNPRDSFFGGRINAIKLFSEGPAKYIDFTSLYPWVNKYCPYPVGHPVIITEDFKPLEEYFGMIKCKIIPPKGLFHPVLPHRSGEKLTFPLCRICVETRQDDECLHNDNERALTGTWVTEEVKKATQRGYIIHKIYEVYHFSESSTGLFESYINTFLKIKQEASGWPTHHGTEEQRMAYIREYYTHEGVQLDPLSIAINPGRRQVAKLCLNSFWGQCGMRENKVKLSYISEVAECNQMLGDPTRELKDVYLPTPEIAAMQWCYKSDFAPQGDQTNIFLAAFTTAHARLRLYGELEKLGTAVLYFDTDSVIYKSTGMNDPPLGDYLGDFTSELKDEEFICTFVSGGPKNYACKTSLGDTVCKIRGFTLNHRNSEVLNFNSVLQLVQDLDMSTTLSVTNPMKITRDPKRRKILNQVEEKRYRLVYDKRVVHPDYTTTPYGY